MAHCKNRIGERCKLDGQICKHLVYDGQCKYADVDEVPGVTFKEGLAAILTAKMCKKRKSNYKRRFAIVLEKLGLTWQDPMEKYEYEVAEQLAKELELVYEPKTVADIIGSIYCAGNEKLRTYYKQRHLRPPVFERFHYKVSKKPKLTLKWEQKTAIKYEMERLRRMALDVNAVERRRDTARNLFIIMWWGWWYGARPGDINWMKWSNIVYINGIPHVQWTPGKTLDSTGCDVTWPMSCDAFNQIHKFIGQPEEYMLTCDEKFVPKKSKDKYRAKREHTYYWKTINKFFRSIGITGWAGFYALRYMNAQESYKSFGEQGEKLKMGHNERTGRCSYYNINDHSVF